VRLREPACVILAGKPGSRRHSRTSFSENVVVAETSYQMLEVLPFCGREGAYPPSIKINVLTFMVKKVKGGFLGCLLLKKYAKKLESNLVVVAVLIIESKGFVLCVRWC